MPTLHFDQQSVSSLLKPTFTLSSSTCFFHVPFSLPFFLLPSTSNSNCFLKTWRSYLLNTWPYKQRLLAIANSSMVSFKSNMNIKSVDLFMSLSCTPHIAHTMDLSVLRENPISLSGTMLHFHTVLLLHTASFSLRGNLLPYSISPLKT